MKVFITKKNIILISIIPHTSGKYIGLIEVSKKYVRNSIREVILEEVVLSK